MEFPSCLLHLFMSPAIMTISSALLSSFTLSDLIPFSFVCHLLGLSDFPLIASHLSSSSSHLCCPLSLLVSCLTCGASARWSSCWCSSWLCSTGVAGSWTGGTACCPPRVPAAGPGSGRGVAACQRWSWCTAPGRVADTGSGWRRGCGDGAASC